MSPDTTAQRHDSAAQWHESTLAQRHDSVDQRPDSARGDRDVSDAPCPSPEEPDPATGPERETDGPTRHGRVWTCLTIAAAAAFAGAVAAAGTNLFVNVEGVSDTPEHSVEALLGALLDEHDAETARTWLCADKADRDLSEATAELASINERTGVDWSNVTETDRHVGEATVTADLSTVNGSITWTFTLVAEDSDPQWQVCDMAVR